MARRRTTQTNTIGQGLGVNARSKWSGERVTPNREQQLTGFHIGQVVDDQDDQRMGRIWVYIPQVSSKRFDDQSLPAYGGTTPDRQNPEGLTFDQKLRLGWVLLSPMTPFFGSDDFRAQSAPDGRNAAAGDVNSYGMWHQPRVGDFVGVLFAGGDPNSGYWTGMVPKQNSNGMVPGIPGGEAQNVPDRAQAVSMEGVQPTARVSTMDRNVTTGDPTGADAVPSSDLARAQIRAGISGDTHRGAGTSGARRESPSYVTGLKSAGWSYDSEKQNRNVDGQTQFQDDQQRYYDTNSVGHSFVMDDHPDHQSMRMRTSSGAQILMQDSCTNPYIYIQSASGNAWVEISDSGDVTIFAGAGMHVHAKGDYNLTVDGDMNIGVAGNMHTRVGGNKALGVTGSGAVSYGSDMVMGVEGQYDFQAGDDARMTFNGDLDQRAAGGWNFTIGGGMDIISGGGIRQSAGGDLNFKVDGNTVFNTSGNQSQLVEGNINTSVGGGSFTTVGGAISLQGGGNFDVDAANVNLNSGSSTAADPDDISEFFAASTAAVPILPPLNQTTRGPEQAEVTGNAPIDSQQSVAAVVPQHQPWGGRCGQGNTRGTNGMVSSSPVEGGFVPPSANNTCDRNSNPNNLRTGSGMPNALVPDQILGGLQLLQGQLPVGAVSRGYRTDSRAEEPQYRAIRLAGAGETHTTDSLSLSEEGMAAIKAQETFIERPRLDPLRSGYVVGYGHRVSFGDTISGAFLDSDMLKNIGNLGNDSEKSLAITEDEASTYLEADIDKLEEWVRTTFPDVELSQQQYDVLISFARNVTPEALEQDERGQQFIAAINDGNFDQAQRVFYDFSYVGGAVDCNMLDRRRGEAARFGQVADPNGITGQSIGYVPQGQTITIAGFQIESTVFNAICNAQQSIAPQLPDGYMFTICAQESAFNPNAKASTSSAAGLFQFIRDTGLRYGLSGDRSPSSNVFDPVLNANAGARFNLDNYNTLIAAGISSPNATDLYMAHFLGAGDSRKRNGAARFLTQPGGAIPAHDSAFAAAARANPSIFYTNGRGSSPRTYAQVYAVMERKIQRRLPHFANLCNAPPPLDPVSDFNWTTGIRRPDFTNVDPRVRAIAERSAIDAGISSLGFNSGYRSAASNAAADGARNSQHLYGKAIDIHVGHLSQAQQRAFCENLCANGITGFGVGTNTFHVDIRDAGRVTWSYSGGNGHVRDILQRYGYRGA